MTTRKDNELIVREENCFVEEMKEVDLRSRRGKFIYNRTYNPVDLNKVSHFSRRGRVSTRDEKTIYRTSKVKSNGR